MTGAVVAEWEAPAKGAEQRDVWLYSAIWRAYFGKWETHRFSFQGDTSLGSENMNRLADLVLRDIRQYAYSGDLPIWGKHGDGDLWKRMNPSDWEHYQVDWMSFLDASEKGDERIVRTEDYIAMQRRGQWSALMTSRASVEFLWPAKLQV